MTLTKEPTTTVETPRDPGPIPPPPKELEEEIGIYKKENSRLQSITKEQEIVLQKLMEEKVRS